MTTVALLLGVSWSAGADTIHLKNGRTIRTPSAKRVGDKVQFVQFGESVSIPAAVVARIERDDEVEEPPLPKPKSTVPTAKESGADEVREGGGSAGASEEAPPPEADPAYWRGRMEAIETEKKQIADRMVALRREERAFLFSKRSTADTRQRIEAAQKRDQELDAEMAELRREARRLGVPAGWLRARPRTTGS